MWSYTHAHTHTHPHHPLFPHICYSQSELPLLLSPWLQIKVSADATLGGVFGFNQALCHQAPVELLQVRVHTLPIRLAHLHHVVHIEQLRTVHQFPVRHAAPGQAERDVDKKRPRKDGRGRRWCTHKRKEEKLGKRKQQQQQRVDKGRKEVGKKNIGGGEQPSDKTMRVRWHTERNNNITFCVHKYISMSRHASWTSTRQNKTRGRIRLEWSLFGL